MLRVCLKVGARLLSSPCSPSKKSIGFALPSSPLPFTSSIPPFKLYSTQKNPSPSNATTSTSTTTTTSNNDSTTPTNTTNTTNTVNTIRFKGEEYDRASENTEVIGEYEGETVDYSDSTPEQAVDLFKQCIGLIKEEDYKPDALDLCALFAEGFAVLGAANTIKYFHKMVEAGLVVEKENFEKFMSCLSTDREVGTARSLLELLEMDDFPEILLFFSFWKWVVSNPESEQTSALVEIFEQSVANEPLLAENKEDEEEMNAMDPALRTEISFDMFTLKFFKDFYKDPFEGMDADQER